MKLIFTDSTDVRRRWEGGSDVIAFTCGSTTLAPRPASGEAQAVLMRDARAFPRPPVLC